MRHFTDTQSLVIIGIVALVTAALRFLPFILFRSEEKTPKIIKYLGKVLPFASTGLLVVYCFKSVSPLGYPYALPELIAGAVVVVLHLIKKNTLLSIAGGTAVYMLLVNLVFV